MTAARVLCYDLEFSGGWDAMDSTVLCGGYGWADEKAVHVISIGDFARYDKDPTDDRLVVRAMRDVMAGADLLVGHYSDRMDQKYMNTRLVQSRQPLLPPIAHVDTWKIARKYLILPNNRQDTLNRLLRGKSDKTHFSKRIWLKAAGGHRPSLGRIEDHVRIDVRELRENYLRLRQIQGEHPNLRVAGSGDTSGCPKCGVGMEAMQRRGFMWTRTGGRQRFACRVCHSWSVGPSQRYHGEGVQ